MIRLDSMNMLSCRVGKFSFSSALNVKLDIDQCLDDIDSNIPVSGSIISRLSSNLDNICLWDHLGDLTAERMSNAYSEVTKYSVHDSTDQDTDNLRIALEKVKPIVEQLITGYVSLMPTMYVPGFTDVILQGGNRSATHVTIEEYNAKVAELTDERDYYASEIELMSDEIANLQEALDNSNPIE